MDPISAAAVSLILLDGEAGKWELCITGDSTKECVTWMASDRPYVYSIDNTLRVVTPGLEWALDCDMECCPDVGDIREYCEAPEGFTITFR